MRRKAALFLVVLLFILTACEPQITEGEVYCKEYRPARSQIMLMPLVVSNGKVATTIMIPYTVIYPNRWVIFIRAYDGTEWTTEDFYVTRAVYDSVEVGDNFKFDASMGTDKEPYTRERQRKEHNP